MQFQLSNGQDCGFVFTHRGGVGWGEGRVHMQGVSKWRLNFSYVQKNCNT